MATVTRHVTYSFTGGDTPGETIKLKRWSTRKFFTLFRMISELGEKLFSFIKLGEVKDPQTGDIKLVPKVDPEGLVRLMVTLGEEAQSKLAMLIQDSVDESVKLTAEQILDWDLEDFVGVLGQVVEMNLTSTLPKNLSDLGSTLAKKLRLLRPAQTA